MIAFAIKWLSKLMSQNRERTTRDVDQVKQNVIELSKPI